MLILRGCKIVNKKIAMSSYRCFWCLHFHPRNGTWLTGSSEKLLKMWGQYDSRLLYKKRILYLDVSQFSWSRLTNNKLYLIFKTEKIIISYISFSRLTKLSRRALFYSHQYKINKSKQARRVGQQFTKWDPRWVHNGCLLSWHYAPK